MHPLDPWLISKGALHCMPVVHYRLECAEMVRSLFQNERPEAVALELPGYLADAYLKAVKRLPEISVLLYQDPSGRTLYLPVEPVDPFVEATRLALSQGIPVHLVDINLQEPYPAFMDPVPDPYAILKIGAKAYYQAFEQEWKQRTDTHRLDLRREQGMAYHLQGLLETYTNVLFLCGMTHCEGTLAALDHPQATPLQKTAPGPVQVFHLHPDHMDEVMATFPFLSAVYETRRESLPPEPEARRFTIRRRFQIQSHPFYLLDTAHPRFDEEAALEASLHRVARRTGFAEDDDIPHPGPLDRNRSHWLLFEEARRHYREETGDELRPWQKKVFWKFARNYALLEGLLLPDFFHLLVGARSSVDDNFCYSLLRLGRFYPWQNASSDCPPLRVSGEEVWLGTRKLRVRRFLPHKKRVLPRPLKRKRKSEAYPGQWLESFDGNALCSFPPEDLVIENYGRVLQEEWPQLLREEQDLSEPLCSSMEDGIDIRETLRRWSEKRIYVKNRRRSGGKAGALVVIYDEDEGQGKYPYRMTWLGEHDQESDMAFYATLPEDHIVGPGISRSEYGGFLMIHPPRRLFDVWQDKDYRFFPRKSEVLLAAGLDYARERWVVYVAARPPRSYMRTLAERLQRQIVYVPIASVSPTKLKRIRVFHILSGHDKREIAKDFIE